MVERLQKERVDRQEQYEKEKQLKDEKHKKALEDIKQRGHQLLKQHEPQKKPVPVPAKAEVKRLDSAAKRREEDPSPQNVFNDEPKKKGAVSPTAWPG